MTRAHENIKSLIDRCLAAFMLILLAPCLALISLLVRLRIGSPILFTQLRIGKGEQSFRLLKFRTMSDRRDANGNLLPDAERLTSFGKFLRASSLDELPQLVNVLRGEMSFIGPRPLLQEYLPLYSAEQRKRHLVKPGITGWSQVNGRNAISWEKKFELDCWYVEHRSFWVDMKILVLTLQRLIQRAGISQEGEATMERFRGSPSVTQHPATTEHDSVTKYTPSCR